LKTKLKYRSVFYYSADCVERAPPPTSLRNAFDPVRANPADRSAIEEAVGVPEVRPDLSGA